MLRLIDTLLILGIVINLIKGADLLLRPHQQKWLQERCDTLALWLDFTRPIQWYMKPGVGRRVFAISGSVMVTVGTLVVVFTWNLPQALKPIILLLGVSSSFRAFFKTYEPDEEKTEKNPWRAKRYVLERRLREWSWNGSNVISRLLRQLILTVVGILCMLIVLSIPIIVLILAPKHGPRLEWRLIAFPVFVFILARYRHEIVLILFSVGNVGPIAMFTFAFTVGLVTGELTLKFLRAFMWRVAEYNKGALAAILLVATTALGVVDTYLRFIKK